jgi:hypothetical protein
MFPAIRSFLFTSHVRLKCTVAKYPPLLASPKQVPLLTAGPPHFKEKERRLDPIKLNQHTYALTIVPENNSRFRISYTCDEDAPAAIRYIIYDTLGKTCSAKEFTSCTDYYTVTVNRILMRRYYKDFNLTFRFIELVY